MRTGAAVATALACAVVLAACVEPVPELSELTASPTSSSVTTVPSAPTATPTPSERDCPTYDDSLDWTISPIDAHRFGPVCVGMTFAEATQALPPPAVEGMAECPWVAPLVDAHPLYIAAVSNPQSPESAIAFFHAVVLVDPSAVSPHAIPTTAEGVGIGSQGAEVLQWYPHAQPTSLESTGDQLRDHLWVDDGDGLDYVFALAAGTVTEMAWGRGVPENFADRLCPQ